MKPPGERGFIGVNHQKYHMIGSMLVLLLLEILGSWSLARNEVSAQKQ